MGRRECIFFAVLVASPLSIAADDAGSLAGTVFHSNGSAIADAPIRAVDLVDAYLAKDGSRRAAVEAVVLESGERLFGAQQK